MVIILLEQLIKIMLLDYQSHIVVIHVSTFGLLLVAVVKKLQTNSLVLALTLLHNHLHLLVVTTTVSQPHGIVVIMTHTSSTTLCGMEQDALMIAVMTLPNLGSFIS